MAFMRLCPAVLAATLFVSSFGSHAFAAEPIARTASFTDVPARSALLRGTHDPLLRAAIDGLHSCVNLPSVPAPSGPMQIPHHYLSGSHGPTNPEERKATEMYASFERRITAGSNQYLATGSHDEAACALAQMDAWARANALLEYDPHVNQNTQSWFQVEWTLSSAGTTISILVNDPQLDRAQLKRVLTWLDAAAHKMIGFETPGEGNNHHYWRALAAISIGVPAGDRNLVDYAVNVFHEAVGQIDANGAFPLEMARHERAIHYQSFALQPLLVLVEFAERQHIPLYAYAAHNHTIRDAVRFLGRAIDDPSVVTVYTKDAQDQGFGGSDAAPFVFYAARFGTADLGAKLAAALTKPTTETRIGGCTTLFAGPAR